MCGCRMFLYYFRFFPLEGNEGSLHRHTLTLDYSPLAGFKLHAMLQSLCQTPAS